MRYLNVLFISEQKLKDNSAITDNVDSSELRFAISQSQTIFLQESLGTNLYQKLQELVDNGDIDTLPYVRYKELLNQFVQPTLISYSYYLALDNFFVKFMNVGLVQNRNEQGSNIDLKTLQYLKQNAQNQAQFNDNLLRRHLIFRSGWYPEYVSGNLNDGQLPPDTQNPFKSSITTPGGGYGWNSRRTTSWCYNAMGSLCDGSAFPTWYGSSNNSPGAHS
jgi:hypothetical protein